MYCQKYNLSPVCNDEVPTLYPQGHQNVEHHQEKVRNPFKYTVELLEKNDKKIGIRSLSFSHIPNVPRCLSCGVLWIWSPERRVVLKQT